MEAKDDICHFHTFDLLQNCASCLVLSFLLFKLNPFLVTLLFITTLTSIKWAFRECVSFGEDKGEIRTIATEKFSRCVFMSTLCGCRQYECM